jgi:hypothetical protein
MNSSVTTKFWRAYAALPPEIRSKARKIYRLWQDNPWHPSLHFESKGNFWSVRIDRGWRALGRKEGDTVYWLWIGPHDEYERLIGQR